MIIITYTKIVFFSFSLVNLLFFCYLAAKLNHYLKGMKKILLTLLWGTCFFVVQAQEELLKLQAETRIDYQREYVDGRSIHSNSGFKGKYLNVIISGTIAKQFSYSYRQRLNKAHSDQSFFDATDWLYLTYRPDEHWGLSVGKQVVGIGGYEYDRAPIDLYFCSEYWNNIPCYQMGISADYTFNRKKDKVMFQLCQSPFRADADDIYSYNLMWYGSHGWFNTIYSVNMIEYQPDKYINYIALGHHLDFGKTALELDFMNRAADHQTYFFKNCSVMGELSYRPSESFNLFGKVTYDVNRTQVKADYCVHPGTELTHVGGGVEFYPLKNNKNLRLHAFYSYAFGHNGNTEGAIPPEQNILNIGIKWKVDFLSLKNKKINFN